MESITPNEQDPTDIWSSFVYDVTKITYLLFVLLEGTETRNHEKYKNYGNWDSNIWDYTNIPTNLSYIDIRLSIFGTNIGSLLSRNGYVEQLAYKGWVVEINGIWDSQYYAKLKKFKKKDSTFPQSAAINDLRQIRNDLVHCSGKVNKSAKEKRKVLKWFNSNEMMVFNIYHILDFLNQIGGIRLENFISKNKKPIEASHWDMEKKERLLSRNPTPKIISVRLDVGAFYESVDIDTDYEICPASIIFDNAFFTKIPFRLEGRRPHSEKIFGPLRKVSINPQGNLLWPTGQITSAEELYWESVELHFMSNDENKGLVYALKIRTIGH